MVKKVIVGGAGCVSQEFYFVVERRNGINGELDVQNWERMTIVE